MEIPNLFWTKKSSKRPRSAEDEEHAKLVHRRFSRAYGVLGLMKRELADQLATSRELVPMCLEDCLDELNDAIASDAYRGFFEREFEVKFRLELGATPVLHVATDEAIKQLEGELVQRFDRRSMEHAHAFGIGMLNGAATKFARNPDSSWVYEPPLSDESPELISLRYIMADYAFRHDFQRRSGVRVHFFTPNRVVLSRRSDHIYAQTTLSDQLRLEQLLPGAPT
ncbi:MAG: hypothetical protein WCK01_02260 [Candidatus Uhrbacteria bacterium]